jgi:flagellar biosynthesis protein FliR
MYENSKANEMNIPLITPELASAFILVLVRVGAVIMMSPLFGDASVPATVKWGLSILITLLLFPLVRAGIPPMKDLALLPMILGIAGELMIGVIIGFAARFIFAGIQLAGDLLGFQMGFSVASVIDPTSSTQVSVIAEFQYLLSLLLFLAVNGHHVFISGIADSYQAVPPLSFHFSNSLLQAMVGLSKDVFVIAIKISAPVTAVLLFTNVAMGLLARTVPQMNVFMVSFPLQIAVGLLFIGLMAPVFVKVSQYLFLSLPRQTEMLMRLMPI